LLTWQTLVGIETPQCWVDGGRTVDVVTPSVGSFGPAALAGAGHDATRREVVEGMWTPWRDPWNAWAA